MTASFQFGLTVGRITARGMSPLSLRIDAELYESIAAREIGATEPGYTAGIASAYREALELSARAGVPGYSAGVFQGSDAAEFGMRVGVES